VGEGWDGAVPFEELPWERDPASGWIATANNKPVPDGNGPFLGIDFMDGYRVHRIGEVLSERDDWDIPSCFELQLDKVSLPWREIGPVLLEVEPGDEPRAGRALDLLREWDGVVAADSVPAAVWEFFLAEMTIALARAQAPNSTQWALGQGQSQIIPHTYAALNQVSQVARLLRERPEGWFEEGWDHATRTALSGAIRRLEEEHGDDPGRWEWGRVRPLTLRHPLGERRAFARAVNLGPIPYGGDTNTPAQASNSPADPTGDVLYTGTLRAVMDVGAWDESRFVLASGESGNPLSPHYRDQWEVWRRGEAVPLPFSAEAVEEVTRRTLTLEPATEFLPDAEG
jgi:penicillin amidase